MRRRGVLVVVVVMVAVAGPGGLARPALASAGLGSTACGLLGTLGEGWWGKACNATIAVGGKLIGAGKNVLGVAGKVASNPLVQRGAGIAAIVGWVLGGAKWTIDHMAGVISHTTAPTLTAGWFTRVYLRIQGLALFFTLLFICAAAAEAVLRSDTAILSRAVFGYLPLAALLTAMAVPLTMLLLAGTDQLSAGLAAVAGAGATRFLSGTTAWVTAGLTAADPFFAVLAGGVVVAAGGALWVEMLIREIAVYVVAAMLPVVFAAMVWPARRVWATRAVEVLVALILSKVAIVAVLALGGAALAHATSGGLSRLMGGLALVILGAFTPWVLLRLIPMAEVATAAVGHVRGHLHATAGIRTPEAALGASAAARPSGTRHARNQARSTADGVVIAELLEQMSRRANGADHRSGQEAPETDLGSDAASAVNGASRGGVADLTPEWPQDAPRPPEPSGPPPGNRQLALDLRSAVGGPAPDGVSGRAGADSLGSPSEQSAGDRPAVEPPPAPDPLDGRLNPPPDDDRDTGR